MTTGLVNIQLHTYQLPNIKIQLNLHHMSLITPTTQLCVYVSVMLLSQILHN